MGFGTLYVLLNLNTKYRAKRKTNISIASMSFHSQLVLALGTFIPGRLGTSLVVCRDNNKYGGSVTSMVKWFCCSAFCTNDFRTRNPQGESIKFYRLPRDPEVLAAYTRILQTTGINWHSGHICAEHCSRGYRENASADFPDVPVPASQLVTLDKSLNGRKLN